MSVATLSNTTFDHKRRTKAEDATGGLTTSTTSTITASVPCSLQPLTGYKIEQFSKLSIFVSHVAYSEHDVPFVNGDLLVNGGLTYDFQYKKDEAGRGRVFAYYCQLTKG